MIYRVGMKPMEELDTGQAEDVTLRLNGSTGTPESHADNSAGPGVFAPGTLFLGKYNIQSRIGNGGMGVVYRCSQVFIGKEMAIKTLNRSSMNDEAVQRFQTEGKAAGSLSHPNLVSVYDFGVTDDGTPYMVMDYVPGKTLQDVLSARGQMSLDTVIDLFIQCADGLAHAHDKGVFHRDIKPSNIVLLKEDNIGSGDIRILDFGIAKITTNSERTQELTKTGVVIGSPLYMSPEQSVGKKIDQRTDIYSLGCVLFECLCGAPPFQGETIIETLMLHQTEAPKSLREASLGRDFPAQIEELVSAMMAKNVNERIDSMRAVHQNLVHIKELMVSCERSSKQTGKWEQEKKETHKPAGENYRDLSRKLLSTPVIITTVVVSVIAMAGYMVNQLTQQPVAPPQRINFMDGRLATPEEELAGYDQKTRRAISEAKAQGLGFVHIAACEFSQSQFEMIAREKWCRKLELIECSRFTPQGLDTILNNEIESLNLSQSELDDECLGAIARCKSLRVLKLNKCKGMSKQGLLKVAHMKNLRSLHMMRLQVSDDVVQALVENMQQCSDLDISQNMQIGDSSCRILGKHKSMIGLNLSSTSVTDEGLKYLGKNVVAVELTGNRHVTDAGIEYLVKNCPLLRVVLLPGTSVTPKGIFHLLKLKDLQDVGIGVLNTDAETRHRIREAFRARKINTYNF